MHRYLLGLSGRLASSWTAGSHGAQAVADPGAYPRSANASLKRLSIIHEKESNLATFSRWPTIVVNGLLL